MSAKDTFRALSRHQGPKSTLKYWGDRLYGVLALTWDLMADGFRQAVRLRIVDSDTPKDALPYVGARNYGIPWLGESESDYRAGLAVDTPGFDDGFNFGFDTADVGAPGGDSGEPSYGHWTRHGRRGSIAAVESELHRIGFTTAVVEECHIYDPVGTAAGDWARFRIRLPDYDASLNVPYLYGEAPPYGSDWCYGTKLSYSQVVEPVTAVVNEWRPARSKFEGIECGESPGTPDGGFDFGFDDGFDISH